MQYNLLLELYSKGRINEDAYESLGGLLDGIMPSETITGKSFKTNTGGEMSVSNIPGRQKIEYKKDNLVASFEMNHNRPDGQPLLSTEYITTVQISEDDGCYVIVAKNERVPGSMEYSLKEMYFDKEAVAHYREKKGDTNGTPLLSDLNFLGLEPDVKLSTFGAESFPGDIFRKALFRNGRELIKDVEREIMEIRERKTR